MPLFVEATLNIMALVAIILLIFACAYCIKEFIGDKRPMTWGAKLFGYLIVQSFLVGFYMAWEKIVFLWLIIPMLW